MLFKLEKILHAQKKTRRRVCPPKYYSKFKIFDEMCADVYAEVYF